MIVGVCQSTSQSARYALAALNERVRHFCRMGTSPADAPDVATAELKRARGYRRPAARSDIRDLQRHPITTGPPTFFHASIPPSICAVLASPAFLAAATAIAERSPKAQKNTTRRPVAAATSRSMPPGLRLSSTEG